MKAVLLIACICIASHAAADPATTVARFIRIFKITENEAMSCINKTNVVEADFNVMWVQLTSVSVEVLLEQNNTRRGICSMTCAAQAQGTMNGAKMNLPKIHDYIDNHSSMPADTQARMHEFVDICGVDVKDVTEECEAGLRFVRCIIEKNRMSRN